MGSVKLGESYGDSCNGREQGEVVVRGGRVPSTLGVDNVTVCYVDQVCVL